MKIKEHIRPTLIILLIITALIGLVMLGAGSHGNISMKNKETATIVYSGIAFILTAIVNGISMREKYSAVVGFSSFALNLVSGFILTYYLFYFINFNNGGGHFPIFFLIVIGIEILMIGRIIVMDIKQLKKNWLQHNL